MNEPEPPKRTSPAQSDFSRQVGQKEARKLRSKKAKPRGALAGFGWFGLIGWSIAVPTLLGVALGVWLDRKHPGQYSWTLMMLMLGLLLGCLNAWHWIAKAHREIEQEQENKHEH